MYGFTQKYSETCLSQCIGPLNGHFDCSLLRKPVSQCNKLTSDPKYLPQFNSRGHFVTSICLRSDTKCLSGDINHVRCLSPFRNKITFSGSVYSQCPLFFLSVFFRNFVLLGLYVSACVRVCVCVYVRAHTAQSALLCSINPLSYFVQSTATLSYLCRWIHHFVKNVMAFHLTVVGIFPSSNFQ